MVALKNEFGSASPFPIFWKSFKRIRVSSSLSVAGESGQLHVKE